MAPDAAKVSSAKTMKVTLTGLYNAVIKTRETELRACKSVAISFDLWTGTTVQGDLIGINYHWINPETWVATSATLDLVQISGAHSGMSSYCVCKPHMNRRSHLCSCPGGLSKAIGQETTDCCWHCR